MKLEVGQFVRVKGHIGKIANINEFREPDLEVAIDIPYFNDLVFVNRNDIIKASYSIIDLIEVGDYVNGVEVEKITDNEIMLVDTHLYIDKSVANDLIKTILTKEQFERYCYKVGD